VLRAEVQLNTERQRATTAQNDFEKAKLQLSHIIGLPLGRAVSTELPEVPVPDMTLGRRSKRAYQARPDYQAANERVRATRSAREAIVGERLPRPASTPLRRARPVGCRLAQHLHRRRRGERADFPVDARTAGCSKRMRIFATAAPGWKT
jgi:hypothetical protein